VEWSLGDPFSEFCPTTPATVNFCESSIFSNGHHLLWRAGLSDIILKGDHLKTMVKCLKIFYCESVKAVAHAI
jgi:hypothetical protein